MQGELDMLSFGLRLEKAKQAFAGFIYHMQAAVHAIPIACSEMRAPAQGQCSQSILSVFLTQAFHVSCASCLVAYV